MGASSTLMASVAGFTALGYGLDRWLGHTVQWMLVAGSVIGITFGFVGFFTKVLRADASAKRQRASTFQASRPTSFTRPFPAGHVRRRVGTGECGGAAHRRQGWEPAISTRPTRFPSDRAPSFPSSAPAARHRPSSLAARARPLPSCGTDR
jgi:hypothetical protein